ncbi:hypothetical protein BN903_35 [Halorubrum sp. AJ67]|nr:hypothetical protein BN903_35 [Halorubrum sp. AJ67]
MATTALLALGNTHGVRLATDLDGVTVSGVYLRALKRYFRTIGRRGQRARHARNGEEERDEHGHSASLHSSRMGHPVFNGY